MGKATCPTCQTSNFVEAEVMFGKPVFYFQCDKCDTLYAESSDGEWVESEPYREYVKNLTYPTHSRGKYGK